MGEISQEEQELMEGWEVEVEEPLVKLEELVLLGQNKEEAEEQEHRPP
jgi:hypothetical protein